MPPPTTTARACSTAADYREWAPPKLGKNPGDEGRVNRGNHRHGRRGAGWDRWRPRRALLPRLRRPDATAVTRQRDRLGAGARELVVLHPDAERPVVARTSGLYHLAILVPDRRELARVIARLGRLGWEQSPTDHVMTKADYLWDPDGNGIEIYTESPEDGTLGFGNGTFVAYGKDGKPRSGRDPIDLEELFSHLREGDRLEVSMPEATKMGHVHLHVADLDEALRFNHD